MSLAVQAAAFESFTGQAGFYEGFDLTRGMTELDPTVITLIIGSGEEIQTISAPDIDPLFEFGSDIDLYFGLSTDPENQRFSVCK